TLSAWARAASSVCVGACWVLGEPCSMESAINSTSRPPARRKSFTLSPNTCRMAPPATAETMQPIVTPIATVVAILRQLASETPSVRDRKTGMLAMGFMIANSAANTLTANGKSIIGVIPLAGQMAWPCSGAHRLSLTWRERAVRSAFARTGCRAAVASRLQRALDQRKRWRQVGGQTPWQAMALDDVVRRVEADGYLAVGFENEKFERQVERRFGLRQHQRCARLRIAEHDERGGRHRQTGRAGLGSLIPRGKNLDAVSGERGKHAPHGFLERKGAGEPGHAVRSCAFV